MGRTKTSQTKHDKEVRAQARHFSQKGAKVYADVSGFPRPQTINGHRPDVIAIGDDITLVIEVETEDSVDSSRDIEQQRAFESWARMSCKRDFERIVV